MNNIILGTMNIEYPYSSNPDKNIDTYKQIIEYYFESTENPILDTAYYYGNTKTEYILGYILKDINKPYKIATKANPWFNNDFTNGILGQLSKDNLERQLNTSLTNLQRTNVDIFYLHCFDYEIPILETLDKCEELWRREKFNYLGISNFSLKQMKEVLDTCDKNMLSIPKYYQGMYNLISRKVEEIFPLLEEYNIQFWGYNPLAGGLLTGKYKYNNDENSRFKDNKIYQNIFWKDEIINNLEDFFKLSNPTEKSIQWLLKYSNLKENDKIIIGVSTIEQLKTNINSINKNVIYNNFIIYSLSM
jgi:aflatoxin B1 aldehyde reductase